MSQNNLTAEDGNGTSLLNDLTATFGAISSFQSGGTDPAIAGYAVANMWWADTSSNMLLKQRNAANSAWVTLGIINTDGTFSFNGDRIVNTPSGTITATDVQAAINQLDTNKLETTGVAASATKLATARKINGQSFDGTADITIASVLPGINNFIASGRKITGIGGTVATISSGVDYINSVTVTNASNTVTLPARASSLIYDNSDGTTSYVQATIPTSYIDNNTVGFWTFANWDGTSAILNSAVGVSSIAVANNLTLTGTANRVDGWAGYGAKLDGTSGYLVSANTTNFPSGANVFEINMCFTVNKLQTNNCIFSYGANSSNAMVGVSISSSGSLLLYNYTQTDTSFVVEVGKTYLLTVRYDGIKEYLYINGVLVYVLTIALSVTLTYNLYVGNLIYSTWYSPSTIHYVELRNKLRPASTLGAISNSLILPCYYNKAGAVAPVVPSAYSATYHEYLFNEASGTSVADSNITSALTGTATGTTVTTSEIGLTNARKLAGSGNYINVGGFACGSSFSYTAVVNIPSYSTNQVLWSNRNSGSTTGNLLYINTSGYVVFNTPATNYVLTSTSIPLDTPVFIIVIIVGTTATVYMNSPQKLSSTTVPAMSTTSNTFYLGNDLGGSNYFTGTIDYVMFGNFELSQAEVEQYYNSLMATGRRSIIDDVLTTSCTEVAFAQTNSTKIIAYNDADWGYGRREKAYGGNRKIFLGWQYFSGTMVLTWNNPFLTRKVFLTTVWAQDARGTNECDTVGKFENTSGTYGVYTGSGNSTPSIRIAATSQSGGVCYFMGAWQTSGYLGMYATVLEDN